MRLSDLFKIIFLGSQCACETLIKIEGATPVNLPYIKNTANECYYLDDFMPVPDAIVSGESEL